MTKVFPLLIIPTLFLILFLNVENLTVKLDRKINMDPLSEIIEDKVFNTKKDEDITNPNENLKNKKNEKKLHYSTKNTKPELSNSNDSNIENDLNSNQNHQTTIEIPEIKSKPNQIQKNNSLKIQFGAFSKLKNAETQKQKIVGLLSTKFTEFEKKFEILEENNLFKLIYTSGNVSHSESICDYSKSIKINCLILKR